DMPAPAPVVWEWLNDPGKRLLWEHLDIRPQKNPGDRTGAGTTNHCVHGKDVVVLTVLDWRPFDYSTIESGPHPNRALWTYHLVPTTGGTRLNCNVKVLSAVPEDEVRSLEEHYRQAFADLASMLAVSEDSGSTGVAAETTRQNAG